MEDPALVGFRRGPVVVIANLTDRPVILARSALPAGDLFDLVAEDAWDGHVLGPFEYRYLLERPAPKGPVSRLLT